MRRGRSRIAHLRHEEYPEKFPDATVSDDVLGRLERAALLRLEALGTPHVTPQESSFRVTL